MYREFLEPTRQFSDVIVGEESDIAADVVAARIRDNQKAAKLIEDAFL
jgi:uridine kinase